MCECIFWTSSLSREGRELAVFMHECLERVGRVCLLRAENLSGCFEIRGTARPHVLFLSFFLFLALGFLGDAQNQRPVVALAGFINEALACRFGRNSTNFLAFKKETKTKE